MDDLSQQAFRAYRELVYETPGFPIFFREMTPLREISDLEDRIAAGLAHQFAAHRGLARDTLGVQLGPGTSHVAGWYGVGQALQGADAGLLREMWEVWPFFRATLDNLEMVLSKSDMSIAARYVTLVEDSALGESLFGRIRDMWLATQDSLLNLTGQTRLLEKHPVLMRRSGCAYPTSSP